MATWHLHIQGQVQGVGFRPYVYLLAREYGMNGWVNNTVDGVHVEFNSNKGMALVFTKDLIQRAPVLSRIILHDLYESKPKEFEAFEIIHSDSEGEANLLLTPDFNMCDDCKNECRSDSDRRLQYPFITCTNCGPRYSIIQKLPYDRHTTTMEKYRMCDICHDEYDNPEDRRYYSQTNSCPACPIRLQLFEGAEPVSGVDQEKMVDKVVELWESGKIIAIKGIGGYLLTCDASNEAAISELRKRKHRPAKPFALMYPSLDILERDAGFHLKEQEALCSPSAPILLLDLQEDHKVLIHSVAPGIKRIGAMLPYTPLFDLLLNSFGRAVIATSGNISNSPVIYNDEKSMEDLSSIADYILSNDRDIVVPQDDSVLRFSALNKQRIVIRRSRGIAPTYINTGLLFPKETILATGAMLKNTFTFLNKGNCYISQYLGDTDSFDTQEAYRYTTQHFFTLFGAVPRIILSDKHPQYFSTEEAERLSTLFGASHYKFQHHEAHFAAVLGEHQLLDSDDPVLGIIWDGTGYGDDGNVWGGESFVYSRHQFERRAHLNYFRHILGDKMSVEPRISLLTAGCELTPVRSLAREKFTDEEWRIYTGMLEKESVLQTSSVGRLFDAVAALLGLCDKASYEGEAAMYLENLAASANAYRTDQPIKPYMVSLEETGHWSGSDLLGLITEDMQKGTTVEEAALKFHASLAEIVAMTKDAWNLRKVSFSGGVFQNSVLVDLLIRRLGGECELYFHEQLSPNDECISFGQLMCHLIRLKANKEYTS
ncbi:MAG: carbamoyltransferase HypF [Bacteroidetes bacterium]|nr:carbamoyltransferase HypF [Bacteroidota bacterium]